MDSKIEILRKKVITSRELAPVASYYLNHFPGCAEFERGSHKIEGERKQRLMHMVRKVVEQKLPIKPGRKMCVLLRYKNTQFVHGFVNFPNLLCTVNYFDQDQVGLLTCVCPSQLSQVEYFRITGFKMDKPLSSAGGSRLIQQGEHHLH